MSLSAFLRRLKYRAAVDADSVRLSAAQVHQQEVLAPQASVAGGGAIVLLFMIRADAVPTTLRFLLSILAVVGFVLTVEAPVHLLVALQGKRDAVGWHEARRDPRLRSPNRLADMGLATSVAATVWVTSFDLDDWLRAVLTLAAIVGFCTFFGFGAFTIITVSETIRTGDRTLADRAERIAVTQGNVFRLLPAPRRAVDDADTDTDTDTDTDGRQTDAYASWWDEDDLISNGESVEEPFDLPPPSRLDWRDA